MVGRYVHALVDHHSHHGRPNLRACSRRRRGSRGCGNCCIAPRRAPCPCDLLQILAPGRKQYQHQPRWDQADMRWQIRPMRFRHGSLPYGTDPARRQRCSGCILDLGLGGSTRELAFLPTAPSNGQPGRVGRSQLRARNFAARRTEPLRSIPRRAPTDTWRRARRPESPSSTHTRVCRAGTDARPLPPPGCRRRARRRSA